MGATLMIWVLIGFLALLLISLIGFGIMFVMKKRLVMTVIMPDKKLSTRTIWGECKKEEKVGSCMYFIDSICFVKTFWGEKIFYYYNNPHPIEFNFDTNQSRIVGTKAQDLKTFQDSDLVQKLFALDNMDMIIMILVIACLLGIGGILIMQFVHTPVELSTKGNNTQIIADAVRLAIKTVGK